jgi:hypothetical protein
VKVNGKVINAGEHCRHFVSKPVITLAPLFERWSARFHSA